MQWRVHSGAWLYALTAAVGTIGGTTRGNAVQEERVVKIANTNGIVVEVSTPSTVLPGKSDTMLVRLANGSQEPVYWIRRADDRPHMRILLRRPDGRLCAIKPLARERLAYLALRSRRLRSLPQGRSQSWELRIGDYFELGPGKHELRVEFSVAFDEANSEHDVSVKLDAICFEVPTPKTPLQLRVVAFSIPRESDERVDSVMTLIRSASPPQLEIADPLAREFDPQAGVSRHLYRLGYRGAIAALTDEEMEKFERDALEALRGKIGARRVAPVPLKARPEAQPIRWVDYFEFYGGEHRDDFPVPMSETRSK